MSRLQELMAELCPDGVKYKSLGELGVFMRGSSFQKKHFVEEGTPCIHYGQVHTRFNIATDEVVSYLDESFAAKMKRAQPGDLIIATTSEDDDAVGKAIAWLGDTNVVVSNDAYIYRHELDSKYMAYVFASDLFQEPKRQYITGTKVRRLNDKSMSKIVIPVPPIEVQREVVRILDEYMAAHDELVRQIEEEMELREQQFSIARVGLLEFGDDESVQMRPLADIATFGGGHTPSKAVAENYQDNGIWWVTSKDVKADVLTSTGVTISEQGASTLTTYPRGTLVMVTRSGILKRMLPVAYLDDNMTVNQDIKAIMPDASVIMPKFLLYVLKKDDETIRERYGKVGGTVDSVNFNMVKKHLIPVPSIDVQTHIVEALDGLAESHEAMYLALGDDLAYQDQQLALVRNQLLSFPEKVA